MLAAALLGMLALTAAICVLCGIVGAPIVGTLCSTAARYRRWVPVLTVVIPGTCLGALLGATGLGFAVFRADPHGTIIAIGTGFILGVPVGLSVGTAIAIARFDWVRTNLRDALRRGCPR